MKSAEEWFALYGKSHTHRVNKLLHFICVPLITFSTIGLFWSLPGFFGHSNWLNWGIVFILASLLFYFKLSLKIFFGMGLFASLCALGQIWLQKTLDFSLLWTNLSIFIVAWLGQFIGHKIEGEKPSFIQDLQFLLVGPAWILNFVYRQFGIKI